MEGKVATPELELAEIASRQHGVISTAQLHGLGLDERAIKLRVASARLHRVHRGVYAVGHRSLSLQGRTMAAVLAVGRGSFRSGDPVLVYWGAAVSHRSAATLWGFSPEGSGPVDVIVPGDGGRAKRVGIRVHRSRSLNPVDVVAHDGIPITGTTRTRADLRLATGEHRPGALSERELRKAIRQANVLGLPIDEQGRQDRMRGDLEGAFMALCRRCRLPSPEVNVRIGAYLADFLWREQRLVVETDHYVHHRGLVAFQDDRERDLELRRLGYEVLRLSEKQINEEAGRVAEVVSQALTEERRT